MNLSYYIEQSSFTSPGIFQDLLKQFPDDVTDICHCLHHLFLHYNDIKLLNTIIDPVRFHEMNFRTAADIFQKMMSLNSSSILIKRVASHRVLGICRHTALIICSILRSRNIPARLRAGFVNYLIPGMYLDGYALQFFDATLKRWRSIDSRTSALLIKTYQLDIPFNLTDLPCDRFITAAEAWVKCRQKEINPARFGSRDFRAMPMIRNRLIQGLALLNKKEDLLWDVWGAMLDDQMDFVLLDDLAAILIDKKSSLNHYQQFYFNYPSLQFKNKILMDNPFLTPEWVDVSCYT